MTDNPEFWQQQRHDRLTAAGRQPFEIGHVSSPRGGFSYVQNEIITDTDAIGSLSDENRALIAEITDDRAWLDDIHYVRYRYVGPTETFLSFVATWRAAARSAYASSCVDLHYVLTGEKSTVPRGGPAGAPSLSSPHTSSTSWGEGPPVVAVLDTGLDPQSAGAQPTVDTDGVESPRVVFDPQQDVDVLGATPPALGHVTELWSEAGHGTFIVSLVARFAGGGVRIAALRVLDPDGIGTEQTVVEGLRRLRTEFLDQYDCVVKVVNLSLGGFTDDGGWLQDATKLASLYPPELRDQPPSALAAELALWAGPTLQETVFVAAAGNDGVADRPFWPAALAASPQPDHAVVVSVASVDTGLRASSFSNRGSWVTVSSLGEDVVGDYPAGIFRLGPQESETFDGRGARWSGTSFAAPLVAAEIANMAQHPVPQGIGAANAAVPRSGRTAWGLVEAEVKAHPALDAGMGHVWDPRVFAPNLDPTIWT